MNTEKHSLQVKSTLRNDNSINPNKVEQPNFSEINSLIER